MLKPKAGVKMSEFEKYGFKHCKGIPKEFDCLYLCVSRGVSMIFVSPELYCINAWKDGDTRIHKNANCRYRDKRDALDITFDLIEAGLLDRK